ncbi:unnamed protein product [Thelazia callipaeda]|uniref:CRAL-TRIO domain-containing protein n=1 Tax=Thelazia callipaeda TaxID=103827 RepID=A0A0N5D8N5_THECL|nr:unnamed protein product [Thelazia callipaeda]
MSIKVEFAPRASLDECLQINQLRNKLTDQLQPDGIPNDLNTDLNLLRWIRSFHGNFEKITKNFCAYVESRKAAGFDSENLPETFFQLPHIKPFLLLVAASRLHDKLWVDERNAFIFLERACDQPKEFIKTLRCSNYQLHCFGYSELLLQLVLRREKNQSADKGPVQIIVLFDLALVHLKDYINLHSTHMKYWQMRCNLWQDWYPGLAQKIYLLNPPRLFSTAWKFARLFLHRDNLELIEFITNHKDLQSYLPSCVIPREYGGEFVNKMMLDICDESGLSLRKKISPENYIKENELYRIKKIEPPKLKRKEILADSVFVESITLPDNHTVLLWSFTCSHDIEFTIYDRKKRLLYPRFHLFTTNLPEEGILENLTPNSEFFFEFRATAHYSNTQLDYAICSTF